MEDQIIIYESGSKNVVFNFDTHADTIWATQAQMAELFDINTQAVSKHLAHIYKDGELEENRTCSKMEQVELEGKRKVTRTVKVYNLDAIISVGYRVNSRKATDFRIWATKVLNQYITNGIALNERRLKELSSQQLTNINSTIDIVRRLMLQTEFSEDEAKGILEVITNYTATFRTLSEYDDGHIRLKTNTKKSYQPLEAGECMDMIATLREKLRASDMFGTPRGDNFDGTLRSIYQSFGGEDVYPTLAEKAANLLYLIIKDHPFLDGNKRIASFLFIIFLNRNEYQFLPSGEAKISDRALTALALMIAESNPREKGLITAVVSRMLEE